MIQYAHHRPKYYAQATVAIDVPSKDLLTQMFNTHSNMTLVDIGLAVMSSKDQFVKKVGRDIALHRMQTKMPAELVAIEQQGTRHLYRFVISGLKIKYKSYLVHFCLTTVAESDRVRLVEVQIY